MVYDPVAQHERQTIGQPKPSCASVIDHFDSLDDFLRQLKSREHLFDKVKPSRNYRRCSEFVIRQMYTNEMKRQLHFNMCQTFGDAVRLAEYGWPEGRERVAEKEAEIRNLMRQMIEAPSFFHDHVGEEVDVAEYLMGTPEHMIGYDITRSRQKFLRITVDVNCRCDACDRRSHDAQPNPPEWAMVRGAVVSLLVQALLRYGFQVEVVVGAVAIHKNKRFYLPSDSYNRATLDRKYKHTTTVTIHRPGWQFDFDRLVFATAHEGFTRKLLFRHEEGWITERLGQLPNLDYDDSPVVVGNIPVDESHLPENMPEMGVSDIHLPSFPVLSDTLGRSGARSTFGTVVEGAKWLLDQLKEVGVTFR